MGQSFGIEHSCDSFFVGIFVFLHFYTYHGEEISMGDYRGQRADVVRRKLEAMGMRVEIADTGYNANWAADVVLDQSIEKGTKIKKNRLISLTINADAPFAIPLPDLAEKCSLREARMKLKALGFILAPVVRISGEQDWVYRIMVGGRVVKKGDRINVNRPITLEVGNGKRSENFSAKDSFNFKAFVPDSLSEIESVED